MMAAFNVSAATHYVSLESTNPAPPYTNWVTAATNIQDAVDASAAWDTVLVTNGVYAVGEREAFVVDTNQAPPLVSVGLSRVVVTNAIRLQSVNGPLVTTIDGGASMRCVFLGSNGVLSGFTLTNGYAREPDSAHFGSGLYCAAATAVASNCMLTGNSSVCGGGAAYGTLHNCTLSGNSAVSGGGAYGSTLKNCTLSGWAPIGGGANACTLNGCTLIGNNAFGRILGWMVGMGGGAYDCTLNSCTVSSNRAYAQGGGGSGCTLTSCILSGNYTLSGGGAYGCTLFNCTLTGNSASFEGGGASGGTLYNCIVCFNTATNGANYDINSTLNYACTTPLPTNGVGNTDADPLFVDFAGGNMRLRPDSPCINAGNNAYVATATDLDGSPRISGGVVDIGAYEFVFTPSMEVAQLILLVNDSDLAGKNKQPLLGSLSAAMASFERSNLDSGANQLHAFQNKVRAQVARIDAVLAEELITAVQQIIERVAKR